MESALHSMPQHRENILPPDRDPDLARCNARGDPTNERESRSDARVVGLLRQGAVIRAARHQPSKRSAPPDRFLSGPDPIAEVRLSGEHLKASLCPAIEARE